MTKTNFEKAKDAGVPSVHLNGTSHAELTDQYRIMHQAIIHAIKDFCNCSPHMRDYYVQGPEGWKTAHEKFRGRLEVLNQLKDEVEADFIAFEDCNERD